MNDEYHLLASVMTKRRNKVQYKQTELCVNACSLCIKYRLSSASPLPLRFFEQKNPLRTWTILICAGRKVRNRKLTEGSFDFLWEYRGKHLWIIIW